MPGDKASVGMEAWSILESLTVIHVISTLLIEPKVVKLNLCPMMSSLSSYHDIAMEGHYIPLCRDGRLKAGDVLLMMGRLWST